MRRRPALLALLALLAAGCVDAGPAQVGQQPTCTSPAGTVRRGLLIMAQAVPDAQWLPCIRTIPPGWDFAEIRPRDGQAELFFNSDRDGVHALVVQLRPSCDLTGATEVPSEQLEMRRYERVTRVSTGYGGQRHYVFAGGCVTFRFDLRGSTRAEPVAAAAESIAFLSRRKLDEMVRQVSDDRLRLDAGGPP